MESVYEQIIPYVTQWGLKVIGAIAILIIGRFVAGLVRRGLRRGLQRANVDPAITSFVTSVGYILVIVFAVLAALAKFGVETTSFVAVLGAAGFAVGFALQGSLSNFAAGVLILVLRPFRVGDFIDAAGVMGSVKEIQLFTTVMATPDNMRILVPNGKIFGDVIKNITANPIRRVDMVIGISYESSMKKARELMTKVIEEDDRVLEDPAPTIGVIELADSSVNFFVRPWVNKENYWAVKCDLNERIKDVFDANGIDIPYPQRTVHMASKE